jgi:antimicrobial peptide system SdpB family protein
MFKINKIEKSIQSIGTNFIWSNKIGVARTVLAMGTLFTLLFNDINLVIQPLGDYANREIHVIFSEYGIFQILKNNLVLAKLICIVILIITASGWRPRITGLLHAWVAFSVVSAFMVIDGGDQITSVLTLLLIPICLVDDRKWHWSSKKADETNDLQKHAGIIAAISYFFIRLQVAFIYFHAGVGKMDVEEWVNGTAIYYWSNSTIFKMPGWMESWLPTLFENATFMTLSTWGVMAFELLLFLGLAIQNKWRPLLMKAGILFHFGIVLLYGLFSFFFAMTGALILYLGPKHGFKIPAIDINAILNKFKSAYKNKRPEISTHGSAA